jgi:hypothetical protein
MYSPRMTPLASAMAMASAVARDSRPAFDPAAIRYRPL